MAVSERLAEYMLKGWALLGETCPAENAYPLVRSRDGRKVCVGCQPHCEYFPEDVTPPPAAPDVNLLSDISATGTTQEQTTSPSGREAPVGAPPSQAAASSPKQALSSERAGKTEDASAGGNSSPNGRGRSPKEKTEPAEQDAEGVELSESIRDAKRRAAKVLLNKHEQVVTKIAQTADMRELMLALDCLQKMQEILSVVKLN